MLFLLCMVQTGIYVKAYEVSQLPIVVRTKPEWSDEYPTVINNWKGMLVTSVKGELPPLLSVVTSINGRSTKEMSEKSFNDILMSDGKSTIEYLVKIEGENLKRECTLFYHKSIYWAEGITMSNPETFSENIQIQNLKNASAFSFNTFAYQLGNVEELEELKVMEPAGKSLAKLGFKKIDDTDSADLILKLSKGRDNYNGYKLSLNILDRRTLAAGHERIIWTLDIIGLNSDLKHQENNIRNSFSKGCNNFPFDIPVYSYNITTLGVAFESESAVPTGKTIEILPNSDAYEKGLRSGDAIVKAYAGYTSNFSYTKTRRCYFKPNKKDKAKNRGVDLILFLPIIPQFTSNNAYHYLIDNEPRGGLNSYSHFEIRNKHGKKFRVYAPFEKRIFNFKYIR